MTNGDFSSTRDPAQAELLLLTAVLFVSYLCVAVPLPISPVYVTGYLGLASAIQHGTCRQPAVTRD
jgi:hypothetical protein